MCVFSSVVEEIRQNTSQSTEELVDLVRVSQKRSQLIMSNEDFVWTSARVKYLGSVERRSRYLDYVLGHFSARFSLCV